MPGSSLLHLIHISQHNKEWFTTLPAHGNKTAGSSCNYYVNHNVSFAFISAPLAQ